MVFTIAFSLLIFSAAAAAAGAAGLATGGTAGAANAFDTLFLRPDHIPNRKAHNSGKNYDHQNIFHSLTSFRSRHTLP